MEDSKTADLDTKVGLKELKGIFIKNWLVWPEYLNKLVFFNFPNSKSYFNFSEVYKLQNEF